MGDPGAARLWAVGSNDSVGLFADVEFWPEVPENYGDPVLTVGGQPRGTVTTSGVQMTVPMIEAATGEPVEPAVIEAVLAPAGSKYKVQNSEHYGNVMVRRAEWVTPLSVVSGTLTVAGQRLPLTGCSGEQVDFSSLGTLPDAHVGSFSHSLLTCRLTGNAVDAQLVVEQNDDLAFVQLRADDGSFEGTAEGEVVLDATRLAGDVQLYDAVGTDLGTATVAADVHTSPAVRTQLRTEHNQGYVDIAPLSLTGSITAPGVDEVYDLSGCVGIREDVHLVQTTPQGPGAAAPPINDTPAGALAITLGSRATTRTTGAQFAPEVEASCLPPHPEHGPLLGRTVWYEIHGTGEPVTVDTAGSGFDTTAVAYAVHGTELVEVACANDGPAASAQARLTFPTSAGVSYLVQVGGWAGESGVLQLRVS